MSLKINTNLASMQSLNRLSDINTQTERAQMRLSSSDRIIRSADDPAGLAISENIRSFVRSAGQAKRNANDGISIFQVAESAMGQLHQMGIRLRELAMQAASDTVGETDRAIIDREVQALKIEIERTANGTTYNDLKLLQGKSANYEIQVGFRNNQMNDRMTFDAGKIDMRSSTLGVNSITVATKLSAQEALGKIDSMMEKVSLGRTELGAKLNQITEAIQNLDIYSENQNSANSRIRDADVAKETAELATLNIRKNAASFGLERSKEMNQKVLKLLA